MEQTDKHFETVKEAYDQFYKFLFVKHGMYPVKDTGIGYWGVSVASEVYDLFHKMDLKSHSHLLDIGSGDGKVVMIASLFTKATGVEYDPWLHEVSNDVKNKLFHVPSSGRASFVNDDFMNHDFSPYDVIFWNPDKVCRKLEKKISNEFNGKLVVYGPHNHPQGFDEIQRHDISGTYITIYKN